MPRTRPTRILTAAALTAAAFSLATWAADPAWARAAGLDVWNVGWLEDQLQSTQAEAVRLEIQEAAMLHQYAVNRQVVQDVYDGRRPLAAAAELLWMMNKDRNGYVYNLDRSFHGPTWLAKAAHHILYRIALDMESSAADRERVLARLRAEYAAAYGVPVPADDMSMYHMPGRDGKR